jgi:hypothetical protein
VRYAGRFDQIEDVGAEDWIIEASRWQWWWGTNIGIDIVLFVW